jgi:hypothetical protein
MPKFDAETGWMNSYRMVLCTCEHHEQSHRPISRKCTLCSCAAFTPPKPGEKEPASISKV